MGGEILRFGDMTPTTPIAISTADGVMEMSVQDVIRWVHPSAPPPEAMKFLITCRMAGVNPFLGEAHLVDHGGRWTTIIDKSGYLRRAQAHPAYAGHQAGIIVRQVDPRTQQPTGPPREVEGSYMSPDWRLVGGWAKVHRNDRQFPTYQSVNVQEYNRNQGTWKQIPCTMIRKVALVQALRESGLITNGWYDPAEVPDEPIGPGHPAVRRPVLPAEAIPPAIEARYEAAEDASLPPDILARLDQLRAELGIAEDSYLWRDALARRNVSHVAELSVIEAMEMVRTLEGWTVDPRFDPNIGPDEPGEFKAATPAGPTAEPAEAPDATAEAAAPAVS